MAMPLTSEFEPGATAVGRPVPAVPVGRVLLVGPPDSLAAAARWSLRASGFELAEMSQSAHLAAGDLGHFDVILVGRAPDETAVQVVRSLRIDEALQHVPVLALSSGNDVADERILDAGADDLVSPSAARYELVARVTSLARIKRYGDELERRVDEQVAEVERLGRLRRFLSPQLADAVVARDGDSFLETHRRHITVLFADLRGFTALTESAEPEEVMGFLGEFHEVVGQLVQESGATVGDFAGDGVMVYFNDPIPMPDATERAVRVALGVRDRMAGVRDSWRKLGHDIDVGVGIAVGYATLGMVGFETRRDYKPVGMVVNLAARLCANATPGQVLISQQVFAAVEKIVDADAVGEVEFKGIRRPVPVFAVRRMREAVTPGRGGRERTAMFGRQRQLEVLSGALAEVEQGAGRVVLISGEPGIGKTRLADELASRVAPDVVVTWGHCLERPGTPAFWPWMQVITELARSSTVDELRGALGTGAAVIAQIVPEIAETLPGLEAPPLLEPNAARFRLYEAVTRFVHRLAQRRPLVIVLEDAHWADGPSLELLTHLAASLHEGRVLVVMTYRDTDPVVGPPLATVLAELARVPGTVRVPLSGLTPGDIRSFVEAVSTVAPTDALVASLHDRTEGNPFFVRELVRLLEMGGAPEVPAGVRDVIRRRLARLPDRTRHLLSLGAVVGRSVDIAVWSTLAGLDADETVDLLDPALAERLLVDVPEAPGVLRFSHALVNQTLSEEIPALQRARIHRQVGEALEAVYGSDDAHVAEIAEHLYRAAQVNGVPRAFDYAVRAAGVAERRLAWEEAQVQLCRALELSRRLPGPEGAGRQLAVQMRLIALLTGTRGFAAPEVGEALAEAKRLCDRVGEAGPVASVLWGLGSFHLVRAEFDTARRFGEELMERGEGRGEPVSVMTGAWALGMVEFLEGNLAEAERQLERAIELADSLDIPDRTTVFVQDPSVHCRAFMGLVRWLLGDHAGARGILTEALYRGRQLSSPFSLANVLLFDAMVSVFERDVDLARRQAESTIEVCDRHGFQLFGAAARVFRGWAVARGGDGEAGLRELKGAVEELVQIGATMFHPFHLWLLADVLAAVGSTEEARHAADEAADVSHAYGERFWRAEIDGLRAQLEPAPSR